MADRSYPLVVRGCEITRHKPARSPGLAISKPIQYRAVGSNVSSVAFSEMEQRGLHRAERTCLATELGSAGKRQRLHLGTFSAVVGPQVEQTGDLADREAKIAGIGDESQSMKVSTGIIAITTVAPLGCGDQAYCFIVSYHPLRHAACA